jgi:hypothetical protein
MFAAWLGRRFLGTSAHFYVAVYSGTYTALLALANVVVVGGEVKVVDAALHLPNKLAYR